MSSTPSDGTALFIGCVTISLAAIVVIAIAVVVVGTAVKVVF